MLKPIAIFGAGGFAREVLQIVLDINAQVPTWRPVGFVVDRGNSTQSVGGLPVADSLEWLAEHPETQVVVAIGSSAARRRIAATIRAASTNPFATLVHPRAWIGRHVQVGAGSVVCAGALITTDIEIGEHVHVNIGCTIGHDAVLHGFATLNPSVNVSGNVTVGEGAEVGTGSILIPRANVGSWAIVGAGSVVTKPLDANVTAVGAPARVIKVRDAGWHER
jgi:sugar O-acyltransferase (sialic acid O-acetyltransferase NeuD family)